MEENAAEIKCDPVSGPQHSDDGTRVGGESEIKSVSSTATNDKGESDKVKEVNNESSNTIDVPTEESDAMNTNPEELEDMKDNAAEIKDEPVMRSGDVEHSKNDENTRGESETSSASSANNEKVSEVEDSTAKTECDPVSGPQLPDHDDGTRVEGEPDLKSLSSTATNDKGESDKVKEVNNESSNMIDGPTEESDGMKDTNPEELEDMEDNAAEIKDEPLTGSGDVEHSKNDDNTRGESETSSASSAKNEKVHELEGSAAKTDMKSDPVSKPADVEHLKNDSNTTGGESEIKSKQSRTTEKGTLSMDMSASLDKQSVDISEEISRKEQYQRESERLLYRLQLKDKHQHKLSPADFLEVGPAVKQHHDLCEKDLAHTFLQRLMMLDHRARYIPVRQDSPEVSNSEPVVTDDDDALYDTNVENDESDQSEIHPMDVQMAVFHCSDSFLKQNMITKLSQCQYALPLLVPDPVTMDIDCPLWTFRQIRKTWKVTEIKDNSNIVTMKSMPICTAETPMVSFLRLGSLPVSKSQLMNTLINDRHSTFFHRNCPGSTKSRHLMDGVAEIAWYCPAGKPNDAFTDCIAFCNLHGDALLIEKQRDILTERSSVNVVLVPTLKKSDNNSGVISALYKSPKPLIILIADNDSSAVKMKEGKYKMGLNRSQSKVSEDLKKIIGNILSGKPISFKLETMAAVSGIKVDEDDEHCRKGKDAAKKMETLLQRTNILEIKDRLLPCQGEIWHQWCKVNKELYHLQGNIEEEKCQKEEELWEIRQKQYAASGRELIKLFIESLSSLPATDKEYFLKWTQILIDALSTDDLSSILQSYDQKWTEVLTLKKEHDKSDLLKMKQTELDQISTKLQSATFGLEHMFREMGQIYEAHAALQKQPNNEQTDWSRYPELAAELMIAGHPVELMDGDAGHVPLTWISSLLDEVIKKLGNKRLFVLSVLGIQSSGKSTMLNAMFGLEFAVSAGRCTRGAFMQLVKVSEQIRKDFHFDYILVVDTEGLRALELEGNATLHHDNELATFVVGLGDMTLINITGENPADMQDVLQIVVQAFMRMKKIKLSPSCVFVHQNVSDIAAAEKNMDGKRRLQDKLDKMAQLAAKEEVCDAECFSDVITFDVQKDVKYFAQLWEGSPPMAPPNPGYSDSVQELKTMILSKASQSAGTTLSQFKSKILDLWNALMNENFVFSFKNTLEIAVYRKLEVQYGNWTWALRSEMLTIENELHTKIENKTLDKIEISFLQEKMNETYRGIKKGMTTYFEDDRDKEMLVQWRGRFENKIKEFHDEQVREVKRKLDEVIQQKNACKKLDNKKTEFENKLLQQSKELAHQLKDKANDEEELRKQFNGVWSHWVNELTADTKPSEDIDFEEDQSTILQEHGFERDLINESKRFHENRILNVREYNQYASHTKKQKQGRTERFIQYISGSKPKEYFGPREKQQMRFFIDDVERQSLDAIKKKPVATRGYSPAYLREMSNSVMCMIAEFVSKSEYVLKKEFTVDLLLYVFHRAEEWLSESHKKFQQKNDAHNYIESKKEQYFNIFSSFCKGNSSAVVLGELICQKLKSSTIEAVCNKTAIDLADEMRCNFPAFNGNRLNLEKHVLKSLAEKENFDGFITYIRQPRLSVKNFIEGEVQKYIFKDKKDKALNILKKNVDDIKTLLSQALFNATEKVKKKEKEEEKEEDGEKEEGKEETKGDLNMWMEEFSSLLKGKITFDTICCQNFSDINNFDFLKEATEKGLESVIEEMNRLSLDKMKEFRMKPDLILIDQLCNCCWEQCPFCAAVCINTMKDHSPDKHNVPFHRPSGISGFSTRDTDDLVIDFCTTLVASDRRFFPSRDSDERIPYKEYPRGGDKYAAWQITPDGSKLPYWKWFVCRFEKELEDHYAKKFQGEGEIPSEWRAYTKQQAIASLDHMYNL